MARFPLHFRRSTGRKSTLRQKLAWLSASLIGGVFCLVLAAKCVRPIPVTPPKPILTAGAPVPPQVRHIFERACQDCHSNNTDWPWYAQVAPVSWMVVSDVERGRQFLNLSRWEQYSKGRRLGYLASMASATKNQTMPPRTYAFLHPAARLTNQERQQLGEWARAEHRRLRTSRPSAQP